MKYLTLSESEKLRALAAGDDALIAAIERVAEPPSCRAQTRRIRADGTDAPPAVNDFAVEDPTAPMPAETMAQLVYGSRTRTADVAP